MDKKIKASVTTLGCRVNQYESDAVMQELSSLGVDICPATEVCDIYIINTCTVTSESDRKSRQLIRRCINKNPNAVIIVTGCFAQVNPDTVLSIDGVDFVCGNNAKSLIAKKALKLYESKTEPYCYMPDIYNSTFDTMRVGAPMTRTRAFIKIEDGCDSKCAYCIIPKARGNVRSNPRQYVIDEVKNIASEGCREIVLTGIETASYGKDFKDGYTLGDLLVEINEIDGIDRIRLGSLDPSSVNREFVDKIKGLSKVMNHFHISMQSGCTRTLNMMKRKYNIEMAKKNLDYLREQISGVMLSADVITGFPGETDEDFSSTYKFFEDEKFLHLHIFPYSVRKGTAAADMPNQVDEQIKKDRLHALSSLQEEIKESLHRDFIKSHGCVSVLFENTVDGYACGHAPNFMEVRVKTDKSLSGQILDVTLTHFDKEYLYGKI
ncbi:MAG: tRNA (N(6)-L-threonylcarbamoyladenosine(37)-C(2))-methylthiotransferase MtaB [Clostridia bacterium]|nr:tRNA (N(6)-L-threonylcarbamoyladenosine(37)-C(2))-methylthiotransferase MtaB [Clostridia bacterium]